MSTNCCYRVSRSVSRYLIQPMQQAYKHFSKSSCLDKIIEIENQEDFFVKVMQTTSPAVIVNFHANWCEPCHILTPKLTELLCSKDDINLLTIDVEAHAELAHIFQVKAIPAILAIRNGHVVDKSIGLIDGTTIEKMLNTLVTKKEDG